MNANYISSNNANTFDAYFYADLEECSRWADSQADYQAYLEECENATMVETIEDEMSYSTFVCKCSQIFMVADQDPFLVGDNSKLTVSPICPKCEETIRTKANRQKFAKPRDSFSRWIPQVLRDLDFYHTIPMHSHRSKRSFFQLGRNYWIDPFYNVWKKEVLLGPAYR